MSIGQGSTFPPQKGIGSHMEGSKDTHTSYKERAREKLGIMILSSSSF